MRNDASDDARTSPDAAPATQNLKGAMQLYDDGWWQEHFGELDGLRADRGYEHYEPAFRYGWESAHRHVGRRWDEVEDEVTRGWDERRGNTNPAWEDARGAVRHAFERAMTAFARARGDA
ncbi:MAG: hypothetical protein ACJ8AO_17305 [Gemmatimonadaceae bacterium]